MQLCPRSSETTIANGCRAVDVYYHCAKACLDVNLRFVYWSFQDVHSPPVLSAVLVVLAGQGRKCARWSVVAMVRVGFFFFHLDQ